MATIITRETGATAKGSPLTNAELDANFTALNTELSGKVDATFAAMIAALGYTPTNKAGDTFTGAVLTSNAGGFTANSAAKLWTDSGRGRLDLWEGPSQTKSLRVFNANGYGVMGMVSAENLELWTNGVARVTINGSTGVSTFAANVIANAGADSRFQVQSSGVTQGQFQATATAVRLASNNALPLYLSQNGVDLLDVTTAEIVGNRQFRVPTSSAYNFAFVGEQAAGTGRYNLYMSGTAQNWFAGNVGIGPGKSVPATALDVNGTVTATQFNGSAAGLTGLKTVNGNNIIGSGDIVIAAVNPQEIKTPINVTPANGATDVTDTSHLTGSTYLSLYNVAMAAGQWQVSTVSNFATTVVDTGDVPGTSVSYVVPSGLVASTSYFWRVRYKDAQGVYSAWSTPTSFTTDATFNNYIPTPTATPANFGDALEGGFYAGMIWNEITQSATSTTIGTGTRAFTVPNMTSAPIVYGGQSVEVRSRANPANRMQGTVTGAIGTTLTINVATVTGSGTFTDWSVMARHRVIVAPKASGESASLNYKNTNTAAPAACITLTEGRRATLAMVAADSATVYPAAHFCNNLNIGGRTDWYLPARDELELCWRNLKPTTDNNYTGTDRPTGAAASYQTLGSFGDTANTHGLNNNSAPTGAAYTSTVPGRVANASFQSGGAEAFTYGSAFYWSSTEYAASFAWLQRWNSSIPGFQVNGEKTNSFRVRAVRRSII